MGEAEQLGICYEAGPTGYVLHRWLTQMGIHCTVAAPSLIPKRSGDRIKTDRRDALRLAQLFRAGEMTAVRVPDEEDEALRDLTRALEGCEAGPTPNSSKAYEVFATTSHSSTRRN